MKEGTKDKDININEGIKEGIINNGDVTKSEKSFEINNSKTGEKTKITETVKSTIIKENKTAEELDEKSVKTASKIIILLTALGLSLTILAIVVIICITFRQGMRNIII